MSAFWRERHCERAVKRVGRKPVAQPPDDLLMGAQAKPVLQVDVRILNGALKDELFPFCPIVINLQGQV